MRHIVITIALLFPVLVFSQIPNINPRNIKLLYQTTGDGLVFRGGANINYTPITDGNAWMHLDTINNKLYAYVKNQWKLIADPNTLSTNLSGSTDIVSFAIDAIVDALNAIPWDGTYIVGTTSEGLYLTLNVNGQTLQILLIPNGKKGDIITSNGGAVMTVDTGVINYSNLSVALRNLIDGQFNTGDSVKYVKYVDTTATIATKKDLTTLGPQFVLTTNNTKGPATLTSSTLNIPNYADTSIYNQNGKLVSNRIVDMNNNSLTFKKTDNEYITIQNKSVKTYNYDSLLTSAFETAIDPTSVQQYTSSGNLNTRIDMLYGEIILRGNNAADSALADLRVTADGEVIIRKPSSLSSNTLTGRSSAGYITNVTPSTGLVLNNNTLTVDSSNISTVNYVNTMLSRDTITNGTLTSGNFTITYSLFGSGAITLTNPSVGTYKITVPGNTEIKNLTITGNSTVLNGFGELTFKYESNNFPYYFNVQMYDISTGSFIDQHALGTNHLQTAVSTETTLFFPGMSLFGTTGFRIVLR